MRAIEFILFFLSIGAVHAQKTWLNIQDFGPLDAGTHIIENNDGSFVISMIHSTPSDDTTQAALVKIDAFGNLIWFKNYPRNSCSGGIDKILKTSDGGFIGIGSTNLPGNFCGFSPNPPPDDAEILLIRTDANGDKIYDKTLGTPATYNYDYADDIIHAEGNNYFICGSYIYRPILHKINENGDTLFTKKWDYGQSLTAMYKINDNYYLAAISYNTVASLMALDSIGNVLWLQKHNSYPCTNIKPTPDGNFILQYEDANGVRLIKVDVNGNLIWNKTYSGQYEFDIEILNDDEYLITSFSGFSKINSSQEVLWNSSPYPDTNYSVHDIHLASDGGILITGRTKNIDFYAMKLDCEGNVEWSTESCNPVPEYEYNLYPNPAQNQITITFADWNQNDMLVFRIYTLEGKLVGNYHSNSSYNELELSNLSSGAYFLQIERNGQYFKTEKIVKY